MAGRRPSGDGLVRKRKDGRWEGRIMVGRDLEGKPIGKSATQNQRNFLFQAKNINANVVVEDQTIGGHIDTVRIVARNEMRKKLICQ